MRTAPAILVALAYAAGCSGPYSNAPEKLKRPTKKKEPDVVVAPPPEIKWKDDCSAKFQEEPGKAMQQHVKGLRDAHNLTNQGSDLLDQASKATDDDQISGLTKEAIGKLRNAVIADPYSAEATYTLAVGYARTRRKGCAIALLKRLVALKAYPDFEKDANRMINAALDDVTFQPFRKDADEALGH